MAEQILLYPFRNRLKRGLSQSELALWLEFLNPLDIVKFEDDFLSDEDVAYKWGSAKTGTFTGCVASTANGIGRLDTGATNGQYVGIFPATDGSLQGASYLGNNSPVIWARVTLSSITNVKVEIGFTDADDDAGGAVNSLSGETTTAHDCAVWCFDTADTANPQWQGVCNANSQTSATKVEPSTIADIAATTYEWLGVAILGDKVKFMHADQYGNPDYESAWQASGITATDALVPWLYILNRQAATKKLDIDYVIAYQRRTATNDPA